MKLVESILTKNPCYTAGKKIVVKGLMLHSVGCSQPNASVFIKKWNKENYDSACVHAFIDGNDGTVYQTLPWDHRGWHGGGESNNTHIGVEMCEPACIKYTNGANFTCENKVEAKAVVMRTYKAAVELFAMLCGMFDLNPLGEGVIISHSEGHKRGIASNHGDVEHLWKNFGLTMTKFREDVKKAMGKDDTKENVKTEELYRVRKKWKYASSQMGAFKDLNYAKECADKYPGYSVFDEEGNVVYTNAVAFAPYLVRVDLKDLNIRKGPGTNYARTQYIPRGVYTIVEEADGKGATKWGRLKSGAGWISLDFVTKL